MMTDNLPSLICSNCSHENLEDAKFCENCGQTLEQICNKCGTQNKAEAKFCRTCGKALDLISPSAAETRLSALQQAVPEGLREKMRLSSSQIEGERKPVTILFTDIVGSTAIAEKLDPEEWKEIVSGAHRRVSEAIYRYEGTVAQLLGDGVLAFFGAPITHEDDPERAVRAALDIQEAIGEYAQELQGYVDNFQVRVGVNTGTVVVGTVGDDLHMEYLAVGDSVNLAARLQSAAEPGSVLISEATARLVESVFDLQDLDRMTIKGKTELVQVFVVLKPKSLPENARGVEGLRSPLVGRAADYATLQEALSNLREERGGIVFILGEAGIGKSRLVEEARHTTDGEVRWLEGRSLSYGQSISLWTITQLIKNDLDLSDADPEVKIKVALRRRVEGLFGERAEKILPYLSHLMGVGYGSEQESRIAELDGEALKHQTLLSISEYFAMLGEQQPTVLVFEDLHWADASTLEILEYLLAATNHVPLLLLLVGRIDRDHGSWGIKLKAETNFAHRYTEIQLRSLSSEESNELVDNLLSVAELPEDVRRTMLDRSEGNPFYLEEVIRSLIDQGALVREKDRWRATRTLADLEIPDTLHGVLLARIDRLEEEVRRTLQTASVIGKSFLYRLLESIADAECELNQHLAQLQRVDLVQEKTRRPELEYIFKHSLTQEAAYNSLLVERRKEFHLKVGEALERLFADRKEDFLGLLAYHFDLGGHQEKAVSYLLQAGDKARLEEALQEAIQHYLRAIDLLTEAGEETRAAGTWLKLGLVYHTDFRFEEAHHANETAFNLKQRARPSAQPPELRGVLNAGNAIFRASFSRFDIATLDPGRVTTSLESQIVDTLFAGIAEIDHELNLVPHAAISWEVLDEGTRYLIHLRDDILWTDGTALTAADFEWSWKRNLAPDMVGHTARMLDDIVGARDYHSGRNTNPDSVAVRSLDLFTLEVRLTASVAYFPYLLAYPVTFPLHRSTIEDYGNDWWKPEHIVSNGAYRLTEFDPTRLIAYEAAPGYFGDFPGNVERVEWWLVEDVNERQRLFREGQNAFFITSHDKRLADLAHLEQSPPAALFTRYVALTPEPPLDDVRIRRALVHALDRREFATMRGVSPALGGMVPPGMTGHSPEVDLPYDIALARRLLAEAGYPGGQGFPVLIGIMSGSPSLGDEIVRQWSEGLGVEAEVEVVRRSDMDKLKCQFYVDGWIADYPDPDTFLRNAYYLDFLRSKGWNDPSFDDLVVQAAQTPNRSLRMSMYREADRRLVVELALLFPLEYGRERDAMYYQPWLKGFRFSRLGSAKGRNAIIEPH